MVAMLLSKLGKATPETEPNRAPREQCKDEIALAEEDKKISHPRAAESLGNNGLTVGGHVTQSPIPRRVRWPRHLNLLLLMI